MTGHAQPGGGPREADPGTRWDELVALFVRDLQDRGRSPHTVCTYETALAFWRRALGGRDPGGLDDPAVFITLAFLREVLRGEEALQAHPRTRRIRIQTLDGLIQACQRAGAWSHDNHVLCLPKMRIRHDLPAFWPIPMPRDFLQKIPTVSRHPYRDAAIFRL